MDNTNATTKTTWADLMVEAITKPGRLQAAFRAFHNFSTGNRLLALMQCAERGIEPGPLTTFKGWTAKGRFVRKGERALRLVLPVEVGASCKCAKCTPTLAVSEVKCRRATVFVEKPRWFVLSQTEGAAPVLDVPPTWSKEKALEALNITEASFDHIDGNVLGYASGRVVRVSPVAPNQAATLFHELAHVVLGHTAHTNDRAGRDILEAEAETVALILCESLGVEGAEYCRGYVQNWLAPNHIEAFRASANRIFRAADAILKAGLVSREDEDLPIAA